MLTFDSKERLNLDDLDDKIKSIDNSKKTRLNSLQTGLTYRF